MYDYETTLVGDPAGYHIEVELTPTLMTADSETYVFPPAQGLSKSGAFQAYENALGVMDWYIRQVTEKRYRLNMEADDEANPEATVAYDCAMVITMETPNGQEWSCVAWVSGTDTSAIVEAEKEAVAYLQAIKDAIIGQFKPKGIL